MGKQNQDTKKNMPNRNYKKEKVHNLQNYSKNSRTHSEEQIQQVVNSINEFGFTNPILVDEDNVIIAGHCRLEAAKILGLTEVPCIILDGLTEDQKRAYVIADNKLALNAGWNHEILCQEFQALKDHGFNTQLTGFSDLEVAELTPQVLPDALCDEDDVPDVKEEPITKRGDVWILGENRVMCGDATMIDDVEKLMAGANADMVFTDPPYNTGMTSESQKGSGGLWKGNKSGSARLSHMFNDIYTDDEWRQFMADFMSSYQYLMKSNSVAYICLDWRRNHELIPHIEENGFTRSNMIIWDRVVHGLGSDYKYTYEIINVCKKGKPKLDTHQGNHAEYSDVWHIQRKMGKNEDHATAKPIELMERAIRHASKPLHLVVDLFGGSGSTLIACEKTNRKCFMMELSEQYCDVIVARWEKYTGKKAKLEEDNA